MQISDKAGFDCFCVLFGMFIDISECFAGSWADVSIHSFVQNREQLLFWDAFFRKFVICEFDLFFAKSLFCAFDGFLFQILFLLIFYKGQFIRKSKE